MDGSKKKVRKVPDISKMTKEYNATSPNMNDQWSGEDLPAELAQDAGAANTLVHEVGETTNLGLRNEGGASAVDEALMLVTLPVTRSYRFSEVAGCDEVASASTAMGSWGGADGLPVRR